MNKAADWRRRILEGAYLAMPEMHRDGAIGNAVVNCSAGRKQLLSTLGRNWVEYLTRKEERVRF
jgi:hypothetical protein